MAREDVCARSGARQQLPGLTEHLLPTVPSSPSQLCAWGAQAPRFPPLKWGAVVEAIPTSQPRPPGDNPGHRCVSRLWQWLTHLPGVFWSVLSFLFTLVLLLCQPLRGAACHPAPRGRLAGARRRAAAWGAVPRAGGPGTVPVSDHLAQGSSTGERQGRKRGFTTITRIILKWQK